MAQPGLSAMVYIHEGGLGRLVLVDPRLNVRPQRWTSVGSSESDRVVRRFRSGWVLDHLNFR